MNISLLQLDSMQLCSHLSALVRCLRIPEEEYLHRCDINETLIQIIDTYKYRNKTGIKHRINILVLSVNSRKSSTCFFASFNGDWLFDIELFSEFKYLGISLVIV